MKLLSVSFVAPSAALTKFAQLSGQGGRDLPRRRSDSLDTGVIGRLPMGTTRRINSFGRSISLHDHLLAVGAPGESGSASGISRSASVEDLSGSGAVYVFRQTAGSWSPWAYVKASRPDAGDYFGGSVSLSGVELAVGAKQESSSAGGINGNQLDNSRGGSGAAYIY